MTEFPITFFQALLDLIQIRQKKSYSTCPNREVLLSTTSSHPNVTTYFSSKGGLSSSNPSSLYR